ncbi:hypothetical protein F5Y14DRAFT_465832 [Nemania sp. NC0429]|nr:hypothetical protein F5Y14DRAFT_465832 [Nemania sp. NC0429]
MADNQPHANGQQPYTNGQQPHVNGQQSHVHRQRPYINGQQLRVDARKFLQGSLDNLWQTIAIHLIPHGRQLARIEGQQKSIDDRLLQFHDHLHDIDTNLAVISSRIDDILVQQICLRQDIEPVVYRVDHNENSLRRCFNALAIKSDPTQPLRPLIDTRTHKEIQGFPKTKRDLMALEFGTCCAILEALEKDIPSGSSVESLREMIRKETC